MRYKYITIEREYGSGGRLVAEGLSKACGIPCYGREILEIVAKEHDTSVERIQQYEETATNSFLYSIYMMNKARTGDPDMAPMEGNLLVAEQEVIRRLAGMGPGIFIGHCAGLALQDKKNVLRVFVRADREKRLERAVKEYGISRQSADSTAKRFDRKRSNYFQINTSKKWRDDQNYDLVLDSGKLGIDGCIAALKGLLEL